VPTFTVPTYNQPIDNVLGEFGVAFPVSFTVVIDTSDVVTPYPGAEGLIDPDQIFDVAKAGSGDNSLAVFRQGRTYTINGTENTLLAAAGYGAHLT
jgi:hypothetical protein